jgi:uncharacterized protein (TIGR02594 family)
MTAEPLYLTLARRDIGQRETIGPNDSKWIRGMWAKLSAGWLLGQPWCGGAVAKWLSDTGYPIPKLYYRALAWVNYGFGLPGPRQGAIAVLTRKGGGHVAFVTGVTANGSHVRLLGGNQDDAVGEDWFPAARVTAYRAPWAMAATGLPPATIAKVGILSKSEA